MAVVILSILAMPISGLYLFRIYEKELVRQTEIELIAQAALVGAIYRDEVLALGGPGYGRRLSGLKAAHPSFNLTRIVHLYTTETIAVVLFLHFFI